MRMGIVISHIAFLSMLRLKNGHKKPQLKDRWGVGTQLLEGEKKFRMQFC